MFDPHLVVVYPPFSVVSTPLCANQSKAPDTQYAQSKHPACSGGELKTPLEDVPPLPLSALRPVLTTSSHCRWHERNDR